MSINPAVLPHLEAARPFLKRLLFDQDFKQSLISQGLKVNYEELCYILSLLGEQYR